MDPRSDLRGSWLSKCNREAGILANLRDRSTGMTFMTCARRCDCLVLDLERRCAWEAESRNQDLAPATLMSVRFGIVILSEIQSSISCLLKGVKRCHYQGFACDAKSRLYRRSEFGAVVAWDRNASVSFGIRSLTSFGASQSNIPATVSNRFSFSALSQTSCGMHPMFQKVHCAPSTAKFDKSSAPREAYSSFR